MGSLGERVRRLRCLQFEAAAEVELRKSSESLEFGCILFAAEVGEHAGEIADRGDGGADTGSERLSGRCASQVFVSACAGGFGNDFELSAIGFQLEYRLSGRRLFERRGCSVAVSGVEVGESCIETAKVVGLQRGDNVDPSCEFARPLDYPPEPADDYEGRYPLRRSGDAHPGRGGRHPEADDPDR